jgi:tetratricopeptide (TPR) repeat protein
MIIDRHVPRQRRSSTGEPNRRHSTLVARVLALPLLIAVVAYSAPAQAADQSGTSDSTGRTQDSILTSAFIALAKDSTLIDEYQKIIAIYKTRKQYQQELQAADHMISAVPSSDIAYYTLADAELDNGDPDAAIDALHRALVIEPAFPKALTLMAEAHSMNKNTDSALYYLDQAIAQNPRYAQAHSQKAMLLTQLGRDRDAVESYRAASELLPDSYDAWLKYAKALLRSGDTTESLGVLHYVITLNPRCADARYLLALASAATGHREDAIKAYEYFILNFPTDPRALEAERTARAMGWTGP